MKASALALISVMVAAGCSAATPVPTRPEGPVLDQADILSSSVETALDRRLRKLLDDTGDALVVVSVESLGDEPIETYATELFNEWGIGSPTKGRGLLILVAPNERQVRIEVGCGAESTLSDALSAQIIEQRMLPHFRKDNYAEATLAGVDGLTEQLALSRPANDPGPRTAACQSRVKEAA